MQLLRAFTIFSVFLTYGLCAPVITPRSDDHSSSDASSDRSKTPPPPRDHGEFVGVRPQAYEQKTKENNLKSISIHPGVVVGGPDPETGKYDVAMISKKLPHDPPQAPIEHYHPAATVYGNIALSPPKKIRPKDMKTWVNQKTGAREHDMAPENVEKLKKDMEPHEGWRPPTPPPKPPTPPPRTPTPPPSPPKKNAAAAKKAQQKNNAHGSGSKHVAPARQGGSGAKHASPSKHQNNAAAHGSTRRPGSPSSGGKRHPGAGGGANAQHGKVPRRSSSPGRNAHAASHAKKPVPRRASSPGPRPNSRNGGKKPAVNLAHKHKR